MSSTFRRNETAQAVRALILERQRPPTIREVMQRLGVKSSSTAQQRLNEAMAAGLLEQRGAGVAAYWPVEARIVLGTDGVTERARGTATAAA